MTHTTIRRVVDRLDRVTAHADEQATSAGLAAVATSAYRRTYYDPRNGALAAARTAGCECVPVCPVGSPSADCLAARVEQLAEAA